VDETVFATISGAACHDSAHLCADVTGHARGSGEPLPLPF
jgi:hypothetical protein